MSLASRLVALALAGWLHVSVVARTTDGATTRSAGALRICADPNNLPYSSARRDGFENRIAELVARDLDRQVEYFWFPQRRGFIRNTLRANRCDIVIGLPPSTGVVRTTSAYYRSTFVFVSHRDNAPPFRSFDDPRLSRLRIGIQVTGDDYGNPPPAQALAERKLIDNVRGYTVYGEYSRPDPARGVIDAVARGEVDVAIAWGPVAGYFARLERVPLRLTTVSPAEERNGLRFAFDIAMAVRREDQDLAAVLNQVIARRHTEIRQILMSYGVPLVDPH
jgi:quinoprotein dehydrogenase-associated probable ABC transporter substrate-binding protein